MAKIILLLILKTLWRIPAATLFFMPLIAPVLAYKLDNWLILAPILLNPILLARRTTERTTHFNQPDVQRYKLPKWLFWMETPDENLPGGLYEPTHKKIYDRFGWYIASMYWVLIRNVGGGITWSEGILLGRIFPAGELTEADVHKYQQLARTEHELLNNWFYHWELTKDFYGTKSGRADPDWRTCDYVAKPEITTAGTVLVYSIIGLIFWIL